MRRARALLPLIPLLLLPACGSPPPPAPPPVPVAPAAPPPPPPAVPPSATSAPTELTQAQLARDAELVPKAMAVLTAFTNRSALLTRAGAVVFSSDRDGLPQLYVGDAAHPKDAPRRLPTPKERIYGAELTPDEKTILFASDQGADGNFHIFSIGVDGSKLTDLTPGEKLHRDRPHVALKAPGIFAYSAHAPASEKATIYLQTTDGKPPRAVYSDDRGGFLLGISPDGKRALFARANSAQDVVVFEVDLGGGKATRVFPPEGEPSEVGAAYSADGKRIFVTRQLPGHHAEIFAIDRKTQQRIARYEETILAGDVGVVVSPAGDTLAITVDGGNRSQVRVLDARTLALKKTIDTPLGTAVNGGFAADGKRFTMSLSTPDAPTDIYVVDPATGAVKPLRDEERPGLSAMPPLKTSIEEIPSFDGLKIPTNVFLPSASGPGKLPTLVSIHGGPSASASIRWSPAVRYYASLGYAIVEPNIRGSTGFGVAFEEADDKGKRADALKDVEAINAWARSQPWCDPEKVTIEGGSYGGYMTLLALARQPSLWHAGLDISGMSDLRTMEKLEDQEIRVYDETEFGILGKEDDLLYEWSPLKYVGNIVAPVFVYQGKNDPITPQNEADQIVKALRERNVPVEYMLLADEGHGLTKRQNHAEYLARTARFLEEHAAAK